MKAWEDSAPAEPFFLDILDIHQFQKKQRIQTIQFIQYGSIEESVYEFSFERNLLVLLWLQGMRCTAEDRQSNGQADIVAVHPCGVFIFELKVDESAEEALDQVKKKGYEEPYRARNLPI